MRIARLETRRPVATPASAGITKAPPIVKQEEAATVKKEGLKFAGESMPAADVLGKILLVSCDMQQAEHRRSFFAKLDGAPKKKLRALNRTAIDKVCQMLEEYKIPTIARIQRAMMLADKWAH